MSRVVKPEPPDQMKRRATTGIIPLVKSVGYVYLSDPSVFFRIFCSVLDTSGSEDESAMPKMGIRGVRKE
jgi:hypothetical protein